MYFDVENIIKLDTSLLTHTHYQLISSSAIKMDSGVMIALTTTILVVYQG